MPTDAQQLAKVHEIIDDFFFALDQRRNDDSATHNVVNRLCVLLGRSWHQGEEARRRKSRTTIRLQVDESLPG